MQNCLTFQEVKVKIARIEKALLQLKQMPVQPELTSQINKLKILKESYMKKLKLIKEDTDIKKGEIVPAGTIITKDPNKAKELAKAGAVVRLTKEQEGVVSISDDFVDRLISTLKDVLRDLGEEISKTGERSTEDTVIVDIEFTSGIHKEYKFKIENGELLLDEVPVSDIKLLPSGEPHLSVDVLRKGLVDYFEKDLDFQDPADQDTAVDSKGNLLEIGDKIKVKNTILEIGFDSEKNTVYLESSNKKRVYGSDKAFKVLLESSDRLETNPEDFEIDQDLLDAELLKQIEDLEQDERDKYATKNYDDVEEELKRAIQESVEVGDRVKISKDYGGAKGKVVQKKGSFIVLDNGESYHESDVIKVSRDFNEDLHIGHQDDEPGMLAQTVFEIANYAADIHKMLKFYENLGQDVNFPNWWQAKVILARDYIAKAAHWLEYETRELDSTQGYLSERRKGKYNS